MGDKSKEEADAMIRIHNNQLETFKGSMELGNGDKVLKNVNNGNQQMAKQQSEEVVSKLKNQKSPGLDNDRKEQLKYGGGTLADQNANFR